MPRAPGKPRPHAPNKPLHTGSGAGQAATPADQRNARDTPAMRQYARFKSQHPECVLFFRMGDFYEMFDADALLCHKVLGLTLTQRTEGIPMAGVPYHSVESYLRRMIQAGHRVAVCEQVQDPKDAVGVVDRAVTRVITPGTLVDESLLEESQPNIIAAIQFLQAGDVAAAVLAFAELSTGTFTLVDLPAGRAADELARLGVCELLFVETADGNIPPRVQAIREAAHCALTPRPSWTFRHSDARDTLRAHFGVTHLAGFGLSDDDAAIGPAGALLRYLQETQPGGPSPERTNALASRDGSPEQRTEHAEPEQLVASLERRGEPGRFSSLAHLRPPRRQLLDQHVLIDAASLRALEIERTMRSGQTAGSLLSVLQRCVTPMGKRLLRTWLCFPLREIGAIEARQRAVAGFLADEELSRRMQAELEQVQDVARIVGRVATQRATPRDLVALGRSTARLQPIAALLDGHASFRVASERLARLAASLSPLAHGIAERCVDDPPAHMRDGGLLRDGIDAELDEARLLQHNANAWLAAYQKRLVESTGISSLKVGYNQVFGYYIEVTHANAQKVPEAFSRTQTLKNAERYATPELREFQEKVTTAQARAVEREKLLFERLCRQAASCAAALAEYAEVAGELDVLACFADVSRRYRYARPTVVAEPVLDIRQGRHPVLDRTLGERFVPNDCVLMPVPRTGTAAAGSDPTNDDRAETDAAGPKSGGMTATESLALITGPNMAGKSTFIRQTALIVLLAHTGCYVPAQSAVIGLTDRIFTRIGASDELHAGQSTFMVEMTETANILHHATAHSLVILDEIGRGTSTLDGLSLAWAIAEALASARCRTLFATHYHELTALADRLPAVTNLHVSVREWGAPGSEQIIFLYRILPGRTDRSYGLHVAKIAGLPRQVVNRASQLLETLAVQTEPAAIAALPADMRPVTPAKGAQLGLFTEYLDHPVVAELRELDLDAMTPMQAFDALRELKRQL